MCDPASPIAIAAYRIGGLERIRSIQQLDVAERIAQIARRWDCESVDPLEECCEKPRRCSLHRARLYLSGRAHDQSWPAPGTPLRTNARPSNNWREIGLDHLSWRAP
jgi:hypothetical protein